MKLTTVQRAGMTKEPSKTKEPTGGRVSLHDWAAQCDAHAALELRREQKRARAAALTAAFNEHRVILPTEINQ
jgi:hypothetical protein